MLHNVNNGEKNQIKTNAFTYFSADFSDIDLVTIEITFTTFNDKRGYTDFLNCYVEITSLTPTC